jgi:hypothetical protein
VSVLLTVVLFVPGAHAKEMKGWIISGEGEGILEGQQYNLYNTDQKGYLLEKNRMGANLGWGAKENHYMRVQRITPGTGPIKCGETVGVFIEKEYIIYDKQTFGINMSTRTKLDPNDTAHQWQFTNCKTEGAVVPLNTPVGLFSLKEKDALVGCKRVKGVNLCWAEDIRIHKGKNYRIADAKSILGAAAKLYPPAGFVLEGSKAVMP